MNNIFKAAILSFFLVLTNGGIAASSDNCLETALTQSEMIKCSDIGYKEADDELNRVYRIIRKLY